MRPEAAMRTRFQIPALVLAMVTVGIVVQSGIAYRSQRDLLLRALNQRLLTAAQLAKASVPRDYHAGITTSDSVPQEAYHEIVDTYNRLCLRLDLQHLWSVLRLENGATVYTSGTSESKNLLNKDYAPFFADHPAGVPYQRAFETHEPQSGTFHDERGDGYMVVLPDVDEHGRSYAFAASVSMGSVQRALYSMRTRLFVAGIAVLGVVLAFSCVLFRTLQKRFEPGSPDLLMRQMQFAVDHAQEAIYLVKLDGGLAYVNDAAVEMLGYTHQELAGMTVFDIDTTLLPESWSQKWAGMSKKGNATLESVHRTKRGDRIPVEVVGHYEAFEGEPFVLAYVRDITDRLAVESQSRELAAAVTEAAESIMITDAEGCIEYVNPYFEQTTGYCAEEVVGRKPSILGSGQQGEPFYAEMWEVLRRGLTWRGTLVNRRKDGKLYEEAAAISPVHDTGGRIVNYVAVKRDITMERALQRQITQSQKMAAVGQLAHRVAHDFTNILLIVLGNVQIAKQKLDPASDIAQHLDRIAEVANRMSAFTAELMAFSQPPKLLLRRMPLRKALSGVDELLRRTKPDNVDLRLEGLAFPGIAAVDTNGIEQAILHLAINAFDAMPEGGTLTIQVLPADLTEDEKHALQAAMHRDRRHLGDFCVIRVSDTGEGIDEAALPRIFEPFFTTRDKKQSAGLGLATVYRLVEQHNGVIRAASQPGEGSTFSIYLPLYPEATA
jgi:PAS domain S-box-containing protein